MRALLLVGMVAAATGACAQQVGLSTAVFAGGRFWALEDAFERVYGVVDAVAGYTGGSTRSATRSTYARDGHVEAVRVRFDPSRVSYAALLDVYWRNVDPTDAGGQFTDRGAGYRPVVFWSDQAQRSAAESSRAALATSGRFPSPIVAEIRQAAAFVVAEPNEQDYARLNAARYRSWRASSGRDRLASTVWGEQALRDPDAPPSARGGEYRKPSKSELRKTLSPLRYAVTQEEGTEPPFQNELWNEHRAGIYVDVISGEPLFSSLDKFDSGTGWPSFTQPLAPANVLEREDRSYGMVRVEVRSRWGDSHLGHLFDDGPAPTGLRYCINSASLRFVPMEEMEAEGYGRFLAPFRK